MPLEIVQTLSDLVALPSVNPMGREVSGREFFEHQVTDYLQKLFERLRVPYLRQPVAPWRDNIVARLDGDRSAESGGTLVMLEAHQDTVPVTGMTIDPWKPIVRDGRLYGRGACDIKGGMAAMLVAFSRLVEERPRGMPTVLMVCTVNEEFGFSGAKALPLLWQAGKQTSPLFPQRRPEDTRGSGVGGTGTAAIKPPHPNSLPPSGGKRETIEFLPRKPDLAIVAEPTELNVVVAHKGVVRWRCHAIGRAAHSSQPQLGDSALFRMARVLEALEIYQHDVVENLGNHPLCGRPTLSVGTISGGISVNTVPDHCTIEIDRRCLPGEDPRAAWRHVLDYLRDCLGADPLVQHDEPFSESQGLNETHNGPLAEQLQRIVRHVSGRCEIVGVPYGTNAANIAEAGVPTVVFGPGSIAQAHTSDEWVEIEQLTLASEAYYQLARQAGERLALQPAVE